MQKQKDWTHRRSSTAYAWIHVSELITTIQALDMADIAVETMKALGLLPGAPEGRTLYAESLEYNPYESSEPRYGAEIVGEQGGGGDYYQLRIMAPEQ